MSLTLHDLLANAFFDRRAILGVLLATAALVAMFAFSLPPVFETEAHLLVLPGHEYSSQAQAFDTAPSSNLVADQLNKAEIEILTGNELRRDVVRHLGAPAIYPDLALDLPLNPLGAYPPGETPADRAERRLADNLVIEPQLDSSLVRIRFRHPDPAVAARVVNELLDSYLGSRLAIFNRDRSSYLATRRDEAATALATARQTLSTFHVQNGLTAVSTQAALLLEQQSRLTLAAAQARQSAADAAARDASLAASIAALPAQVLLAADRTSEAESGNSRATLLSLQLHRQELASKYPADSPYIANIDRQIGALRGFEQGHRLRSSTARNTGPNPAVEALALDLDGAAARHQGELVRADEVERQAATVRERLLEIGRLALEERSLVRDVDRADTRYAILVRRTENALAAESIEQARTGNVRITQLASPGRRASSGRALVLGVGLFVALLLAGATGLLRAILRDVMLTPTEAAHRLGLPLLASVPETGDGRARRDRAALA